jgi:SAM-dependent methyltransferase
MTLDVAAFTAFERAAHDRIAPAYAQHFAPLTSLAVESLLDAAEISVGRAVLDVATGPGFAAGAAAARGARAVGVDVAPGMVAVASRMHQGIDFRVAEVTDLPFPGGTFDAVICNFGIGHFPAPDAAVAECRRVLAPGGMLALTWWDHPSRQRVQGLFREVIAELALPPPPDVPQGHDTLRFSDVDAFARLLRDADLHDVVVTAHRTTYLMPDLDALWQAGLGGMAVTAGAIAAQDARTQARAKYLLSRRAEAYRTNGGLEIPIAYLVGVGRNARPSHDR